MHCLLFKVKLLLQRKEAQVDQVGLEDLVVQVVQVVQEGQVGQEAQVDQRRQQHQSLVLRRNQPKNQVR